MAAYRVKPSNWWRENGKEVILEDRLENVENLFTEDFENDKVGANYITSAHSVSFSDICTFTVELPTSEHWTPEEKVA